MDILFERIEDYLESVGLTAQVVRGMIATGETTTQLSPTGEIQTVPVLKEGIQVVFEGTPTAEQLAIVKLIESGRFDSVDIQDLIGNRASFKASQLYNKTPQQARDWVQAKIDSITTLAQAKTMLSQMLPEIVAAIVYLARQSRLEE